MQFAKWMLLESYRHKLIYHRYPSIAAPHHVKLTIMISVLASILPPFSDVQGDNPHLVDLRYANAWFSLCGVLHPDSPDETPLPR
jgi:hypothetical protein